MRFRSALPFVGTVLAGAAGYLSGWAVRDRVSSVAVDRQYDDSALGKDLSPPEYRMINPLLECHDFSSAKLLSHAALRDVVEDYISEAYKAGQATKVAVYFREFNDGTWMGIDQDTEFAPASLLKVPIMIAVLRASETDPAILGDSIFFKEPALSRFGTSFSSEQITVGRWYGIKELTARMVAHSDNEAQHLLTQFIGAKKIRGTMEEIGLMRPGENAWTDFASVREYASVFRLLYNSTYLGRPKSDMALQLLTGSDFNKGLTAAIPEGTVVAHKFGEGGSAETGVRQLHDCGVVYTRSPYLLCVMTRGHDLEVQAKIIASISRIVYNAVAAPH